MRSAAIAVLLALAITGCSKKKKQEQTGDAPAAAEESKSRVLSEAEQTREAQRQKYLEKRQEIRRRRLPMPIAAEDVESEIPKLEGAEPVSEPVADSKGRQVTAELCLSASDPPAAAKALATKLEAEGWTDLHSRAARRGNGVGMSGQKPPLRLTAMIRDDSPRCEGKQGSIHALLRYHKLRTPPHAGK